MSVIRWNVRPRWKRNDLPDGPDRLQAMLLCDFAVGDRKSQTLYVISKFENESDLTDTMKTAMMTELIEKIVEHVAKELAQCPSL